MKEAKAFARKQEKMGDIVFSVAKTVPGEPPKSMSAWISAQSS